MARETLKAQLKQIRSLTPSMRELTVDVSQPISFKTGQFMMLHVPQTSGKPALRAYSLASEHGTQKTFKLILKLVPAGISSEFVRQLRGGENLEFTGPFGKCFFKTPAPERVIFLCTGAGLSQHFSMLVSEAKNFPQTEFHLLMGVWNQSEIFYEQELEQLKKALPRFSYDFVIDKTEPTWSGKKGYVTDYLEGFQILSRPTHVYLCGNPAMIESAKKILLEDMAVPKDQVVIESFG